MSPNHISRCASFILNEVALRSMSPAAVVAGRWTVTAVLTWLLLARRGQLGRFGTAMRVDWRHFFVLSLVGAALVLGYRRVLPLLVDFALYGDGQRDLIAVGPTKVWAVLAPSWKVVELADTAGGGTIHAVALDADGDGDLDLALGRSSSDWIRHRENVTAGNPSREPTGSDWTVAWLENTGRTDAPWPVPRFSTCDGPPLSRWFSPATCAAARSLTWI